MAWVVQVTVLACIQLVLGERDSVRTELTDVRLENAALKAEATKMAKEIKELQSSLQSYEGKAVQQVKKHQTGSAIDDASNKRGPTGYETCCIMQSYVAGDETDAYCYGDGTHDGQDSCLLTTSIGACSHSPFQNIDPRKEEHRCSMLADACSCTNIEQLGGFRLMMRGCTDPEDALYKTKQAGYTLRPGGKCCKRGPDDAGLAEFVNSCTAEQQ